MQIPVNFERLENVDTRGFWDKFRRLDLEYAIEWNRQKGKDIPPIKDNLSKDKIINYCQLYDVDTNVPTYRDIHGAVRIQRPPRQKEEVKEDVKETKEAVEEAKESSIAELRALAKEKGVNSFGKSKEQLMAELNDNPA